MPYNRWIGQAVATQEVKYYIPKTVGAGDRFQFSDGLIRNGYTYPVIPPEVYLTATDKARRVVEALVSGTAEKLRLRPRVRAPQNRRGRLGHGRRGLRW